MFGWQIEKLGKHFSLRFCYYNTLMEVFICGKNSFLYLLKNDIETYTSSCIKLTLNLSSQNVFPNNLKVKLYGLQLKL